MDLQTYLGYPITTVLSTEIFYNDDTLYYAAGSIRENVPGWYHPSNHPGGKYLDQTGQILRNINGENYSAADHLRTRVLYKNLRKSIEDHGLQTPLAAVQWHSFWDRKWTFPLKYPFWEDFWNSKQERCYWRVIQGGTRLFVLKDLGWEYVPVIDISEESRKSLLRGKCPSRRWIDSKEKGGRSKYDAENVGFYWDKAHNTLLEGNNESQEEG